MMENVISELALEEHVLLFWVMPIYTMYKKTWHLNSLYSFIFSYLNICYPMTYMAVTTIQNDLAKLKMSFIKS